MVLYIDSAMERLYPLLHAVKPQAGGRVYVRVRFSGTLGAVILDGQLVKGGMLPDCDVGGGCVAVSGNIVKPLFGNGQETVFYRGGNLPGNAALQIHRTEGKLFGKLCQNLLHVNGFIVQVMYAVAYAGHGFV